MDGLLRDAGIGYNAGFFSLSVLTPCQRNTYSLHVTITCTTDSLLVRSHVPVGDRHFIVISIIDLAERITIFSSQEATTANVH